MITSTLRQMIIKLAPNQSILAAISAASRNQFQIREARLHEQRGEPSYAKLLVAFKGRTEDEPQALRDIESALLH